MRTALVTANVFQNALANRDACWPYYAELLRRLAAQPITWYMTSFDYALAITFWSISKLGSRLAGDPACQEAYQDMLRRVRVCPIDEDIVEGANKYHINFCDALRVACARDRFVDCIVTWEPHQFARSREEHNQVQLNECFTFPIRVEDGESGEMIYLEIDIFSVRAFLLNLQQNELQERRRWRSRRSQRFYLEDFSLHTGSTHDAAITLRDLTGRSLQGNATGNTPIDALQKAIDQAVDQQVEIPTRYLSRWFVPPATLFGADAPIEVVIGVECAGSSYETGASHSNVLQAAAEAYIQVINRICSDFSHFPDVS
ncbi:alpha-isopropylmalate synthase regulatory domain-containing protein [Leptodesmis sichuanensis]|uniref:alpha-isopropylmalate synthase regulatory domain-containing protein n=1 Tax=Leptodesmis sichuanensis TaxID=2906798 RepID=UPI001F1CDB29|nr:alpha-isopropylmalate synthase regulatory domain-containing protein [Leptodesmis sichuanensis]UIE37040.1 hypothetical protein KIK02_18935 [Leptodesmis sichuanensis A121]